MPALLLCLERRAAPEIGLGPADDPAQPGLQRRDAGAELVTVQRQTGFEPQRVARAQPRGFDPGRAQRVPECGRVGGLDVELDPVLARVPRSRDDQLADVLHCEAGHGRGRGVHCGEQRSGLRALDREHGPGRGDVGELDLAVGVRDALGERGEELVGVRRVRHHEESVGVEPPHDDVVDDVRVARIEEMGVLRATAFDLAQVVREQPLQQFERARSPALDRAQVRDVEDDGARATRAVLVEHARVLQGHVPPAERHHAGVERAVLCVERAVMERGLAHAVSAVASVASVEAGRATRPRSNGVGATPAASTPASTSCDGGSSPYFTSRCR